jgi:hypothetical protein
MGIGMLFFHIWGKKEGCNEIAPCGITSTIDFKNVQDIYYFKTQIH